MNTSMKKTRIVFRCSQCYGHVRHSKREFRYYASCLLFPVLYLQIEILCIKRLSSSSISLKALVNSHQKLMLPHHNQPQLFQNDALQSLKNVGKCICPKLAPFFSGLFRNPFKNFPNLILFYLHSMISSRYCNHFRGRLPRFSLSSIKSSKI